MGNGKKPIRLKFKGQLIDKAINFENNEFDHLKLSAAYDVSSKRASKEHEELCDENDILILKYEDQREWITCASELVNDKEKIFTESKRDGAIHLKSGIAVPNSRGFLKLIGVDFFTRKLKKKLTNKGIEIAAKKIDQQIVKNPGLFFVTDKFRLENFSKNKVEKGKKYLLLIHGFISKTKNSFSDLNSQEESILWSQIQSMYEGRILAFDHHTISQSPIENALELMNELPAGIELDILSFSRGGLIADMLSLCCKIGESGKKNLDFKVITDKIQRHKFKLLVAIAAKKKIKLRRTTRVSAPANGTQLLSKRLDIFLNGLLTAIGLAVGENPFYKIIKSFFVDLISAKADTSILPGIAAMVPGKEYVNFINQCDIKPSDELLVIEGDSEIGGKLWRSIAVILMNLLQGAANDLVVHTDSMRFGLKRIDGVRMLRSESREITHFKYLVHHKTLNGISHALKWNGKSELEDFEHLSFDQLSAELTSGNTRSQRLMVSSKTPKSDPDIIDKLFNVKRENEKYKCQLNVSLLHADLIYAKYPVVVGHFAGDEILHAEYALDVQLQGKLKDRFLLGNYPSSKESAEIVLTPNEEHKGGIVMGLGEAVNFTASELRAASLNATLKYAIEIRDKYQSFYSSDQKIGMSPILIGSGYGGLSMKDSITSILFGISDANNKILELNELFQNETATDSWDEKELVPITEVQFIELYEDTAKKAHRILKSFIHLSYNLNIEYTKKINKGFKSQKRVHIRNLDISYWHNLVTKIKVNPSNNNLHSINYLSSSGAAKITEVTEFFSKDLINKIADNFTTYNYGSNNYNNLLYNVLVPKRIRYELAKYPNVQWKMDLETAAYPWELLHDSKNDKEPVFVNSGLIRQLISRADYPYENIIRSNKALIIGEPKTNDMSALPHALEEAEWLDNFIQLQPTWETNFLAKKNAIQIMSALNTEYKLMHIAGHGLYDEESDRAGIVIEDVIIGSKFFKTLPNIPEFAFINCCYSGDINPKFEKEYKNKYKLAASLGMQLIEQGVEAVVITGWAVDDDAAKDFSKTFYTKMFEGEYFGDAMKIARREIYDKYPNSNTWAAYQCYGNPHYKINRRRSASHEVPFEDEDAMLAEIYNLKERCVDKSTRNIDQTKTKLEKYLKKEKNIITPRVLEQIAATYFEMYELVLAQGVYEKMINEENSNYSLKGLEQYHNLLIKLKLLDYKVSNVPPTDAEIDILLRPFENLIEISPTSERYAMLASAYKRLAFMASSKKNRDSYLNKMMSNYKKGIGETGNRKVYHYTNFLVGKFLLKDSFRTPSDQDFKSALKEISEIKTRLRAPGHNDFWDDIQKINLMTTELLFKPNNNLTTEIQNIYTLRFKRGGTLKNLQSEIEQFEFLEKMFKIKSEEIKDKKTLSSQFNRMKKSISAFSKIINTLNTL